MKTRLSCCRCDELLFFRAASVSVKEHSLQLLVSSSLFCFNLKLKKLISINSIADDDFHTQIEAKENPKVTLTMILLISY